MLFRCELCNTFCTTQEALDKHFLSEAHKVKIEKKNEKEPKSNSTKNQPTKKLSSEKNVETSKHKQGQKHVQKGIEPVGDNKKTAHKKIGEKQCNTKKVSDSSTTGAKKSEEKSDKKPSAVSAPQNTIVQKKAPAEKVVEKVVVVQKAPAEKAVEKVTAAQKVPTKNVVVKKTSECAANLKKAPEKVSHIKTTVKKDLEKKPSPIPVEANTSGKSATENKPALKIIEKKQVSAKVPSTKIQQSNVPEKKLVEKVSEKKTLEKTMSERKIAATKSGGSNQIGKSLQTPDQNSGKQKMEGKSNSTLSSKANPVPSKATSACEMIDDNVDIDDGANINNDDMFPDETDMIVLDDDLDETINNDLQDTDFNEFYDQDNMFGDYENNSGHQSAIPQCTIFKLDQIIEDAFKDDDSINSDMDIDETVQGVEPLSKCDEKASRSTDVLSNEQSRKRSHSSTVIQTGHINKAKRTKTSVVQEPSKQTAKSEVDVSNIPVTKQEKTNKESIKVVKMQEGTRTNIDEKGKLKQKLGIDKQKQETEASMVCARTNASAMSMKKKSQVTEEKEKTEMKQLPEVAVAITDSTKTAIATQEKSQAQITVKLKQVVVQVTKLQQQKTSSGDVKMVMSQKEKQEASTATVEKQGVAVSKKSAGAENSTKIVSDSGSNKSQQIVKQQVVSVTKKQIVMESETLQQQKKDKSTISKEKTASVQSHSLNTVEKKPVSSLAKTKTIIENSEKLKELPKAETDSNTKPHISADDGKSQKQVKEQTQKVGLIRPGSAGVKQQEMTDDKIGKLQTKSAADNLQQQEKRKIVRGVTVLEKNSGGKPEKAIAATETQTNIKKTEQEPKAQKAEEPNVKETETCKMNVENQQSETGKTQIQRAQIPGEKESEAAGTKSDKLDSKQVSKTGLVLKEKVQDTEESKSDVSISKTENANSVLKDELQLSVNVDKPVTDGEVMIKDSEKMQEPCLEENKSRNLEKVEGGKLEKSQPMPSAIVTEVKAVSMDKLEGGNEVDKTCQMKDKVFPKSNNLEKESTQAVDKTVLTTVEVSKVVNVNVETPNEFVEKMETDTEVLEKLQDCAKMDIEKKPEKDCQELQKVGGTGLGVIADLKEGEVDPENVTRLGGDNMTTSYESEKNNYESPKNEIVNEDAVMKPLPLTESVCSDEGKDNPEAEESSENELQIKIVKVEGCVEHFDKSHDRDFVTGAEQSSDDLKEPNVEETERLCTAESADGNFSDVSSGPNMELSKAVEEEKDFKSDENKMEDGDEESKTQNKQDEIDLVDTSLNAIDNKDDSKADNTLDKEVQSEAQNRNEKEGSTDDLNKGKVDDFDTDIAEGIDSGGSADDNEDDDGMTVDEDGTNEADVKECQTEEDSNIDTVEESSSEALEDKDGEEESEISKVNDTEGEHVNTEAYGKKSDKTGSETVDNTEEEDAQEEEEEDDAGSDFDGNEVTNIDKANSVHSEKDAEEEDIDGNEGSNIDKANSLHSGDEAVGSDGEMEDLSALLGSGEWEVKDEISEDEGEEGGEKEEEDDGGEKEEEDGGEKEDEKEEEEEGKAVEENADVVKAYTDVDQGSPGSSILVEDEECNTAPCSPAHDDEDAEVENDKAAEDENDGAAEAETVEGSIIGEKMETSPVENREEIEPNSAEVPEKEMTAELPVPLDSTGIDADGTVNVKSDSCSAEDITANEDVPEKKSSKDGDSKHEQRELKVATKKSDDEAQRKTARQKRSKRDRCQSESIFNFMSEALEEVAKCLDEEGVVLDDSDSSQMEMPTKLDDGLSPVHSPEDNSLLLDDISVEDFKMTDTVSDTSLLDEVSDFTDISDLIEMSDISDVDITEFENLLSEEPMTQPSTNDAPKVYSEVKIEEPLSELLKSAIDQAKLKPVAVTLQRLDQSSLSKWLKRDLVISNDFSSKDGPANKKPTLDQPSTSREAASTSVVSADTKIKNSNPTAEFTKKPDDKNSNIKDQANSGQKQNKTVDKSKQFMKIRTASKGIGRIRRSSSDSGTKGTNKNENTFKLPDDSSGNKTLPKTKVAANVATSAANVAATAALTNYRIPKKSEKTEKAEKTTAQNSKTKASEGSHIPVIGSKRTHSGEPVESRKRTTVQSLTVSDEKDRRSNSSSRHKNDDRRSSSKSANESNVKPDRGKEREDSSRGKEREDPSRGKDREDQSRSRYRESRRDRGRSPHRSPSLEPPRLRADLSRERAARRARYDNSFDNSFDSSFDRNRRPDYGHRGSNYDEPAWRRDSMPENQPPADVKKDVSTIDYFSDYWRLNQADLKSESEGGANREFDERPWVAEEHPRDYIPTPRHEQTGLSLNECQSQLFKTDDGGFWSRIIPFADNEDDDHEKAVDSGATPDGGRMRESCRRSGSISEHRDRHGKDERFQPNFGTLKGKEKNIHCLGKESGNVHDSSTTLQDLLACVLTIPTLEQIDKETTETIKRNILSKLSDHLQGLKSAQLKPGILKLPAALQKLAMPTASGSATEMRSSVPTEPTLSNMPPHSSVSPLTLASAAMGAPHQMQERSPANSGIMKDPLPRFGLGVQMIPSQANMFSAGCMQPQQVDDFRGQGRQSDRLNAAPAGIEAQLAEDQKVQIARELSTLLASTGRTEVSEDLLQRLVQQTVNTKFTNQPSNQAGTSYPDQMLRSEPRNYPPESFASSSRARGDMLGLEGWDHMPSIGDRNQNEGMSGRGQRFNQVNYQNMQPPSSSLQGNMFANNAPGMWPPMNERSDLQLNFSSAVDSRSHPRHFGQMQFPSPEESASYGPHGSHMHGGDVRSGSSNAVSRLYSNNNNKNQF